MKTKALLFMLLLATIAGITSCKKVFEICTCPPGGGGKDTTSFASTAALKLDSFRNEQIGEKIAEFGQFAVVTYKMSEGIGTWIGGGTISNLYDLNDGWRCIKYEDYSSMEPDAYIVYKEGETLPVESSECGGVIDVPKTYMFIPPGSMYYTSDGWVLISNQTLLFDENHPLPFDNSIICGGNTVNAASNETWAIYFSFIN
jgi:hypothetical protein